MGWRIETIKMTHERNGAWWWWLGGYKIHTYIRIPIYVYVYGLKSEPPVLCTIQVVPLENIDCSKYRRKRTTKLCIYEYMCERMKAKEGSTKFNKIYFFLQLLLTLLRPKTMYIRLVVVKIANKLENFV